jgi:phosphonate transport system permease protein
MQVLPVAGRQAPAPADTAEQLLGLIDGNRRRSRRETVIAATVVMACVVLAAVVGKFDLGRLVEGVPKLGDFLSRLVPNLRADHLIADVGAWYWGLGKWLDLLLVTLLMAMLATTLGTIIGGCLGFAASRNLVRRRLVYFAARRALEVTRTVPDLVWALVFVFAFGLGPLAGVLAIAVHTIGAQGKLFAEANENIDMHPVEGVRAAGGNWLEEIAYGVIPQVLPNYVSYSFWRFEVNVRLATVVGFVGAGGIGLELYEALGLGYFDDAGAILLIVAVTVMLIDMMSEALRLRLSGVVGAKL